MINKRILYVGEHTDVSKKIKKYVKANYPQWLDESNPEYILVAGGDGSMLHAVQKYAHLKVPFIGIGAGTLNFLMNPIKSEIEDFIEKLDVEKFTIISTPRIKVSVTRKIEGKREVVYEKEATNDIVIGNRINDYHHIKLKSHSETLKTDFKGMGMIIASPLGSTAMSHNNDVPVIPSLEMPIFSISSIVAEKSKSFKKFVNSTDKIFAKVSTRTMAQVLIDGSASSFDLQEGDKITFEEGTHVQIGFRDLKNFEIKRANLF